MRLALLCVVTTACTDAMLPDPPVVERLADIGQLSSGWNGELIATVDQSYAGWDLELADLDGDGVDEILAGTAPNSRVDMYQHRDGVWSATTLVEDLATATPGMVLGVKVADVDGDRMPELVAGTGEENGEVARLAVFELDGGRITQMARMHAPQNNSSYTHGLAVADLDHDGKQELVAAYCGDGEVIRYDVEHDGSIASRKLMQVSGSGEDAWLVDVDGDGARELVVSNAYRARSAKIEIYDLDPATGEPGRSPRLVLDSFEGRRMFYASLVVGDLDGDQRPELIVGWKEVQSDNRATIVAYRVEGQDAAVAYVLARRDSAFDMAYFQNMMGIADVDLDGRPELLVSTRGDNASEGISSTHAGQVFALRVAPDGTIRRDLVIDFDPLFAESSWLTIGDLERDGRPDVVVATGRGDRRDPGWSYVVRLWHE
jgi:hypothetical protein